MTLCVDLMQNQELLRSPIGEAYYARQQWQYFLGVVRCNCSADVSEENPTFYTWGEYQGGREVNEIGSALLDYLLTKLPPGTKRVRLFSDNCPGQSKNYAMLSMLSAFSARTKAAIDYFFPIKGHSYLPADRAFGRVEKQLRRHETILLPSEYIDEFGIVGEV